jgi:hypothetical protein
VGVTRWVGVKQTLRMCFIAIIKAFFKEIVSMMGESRSSKTYLSTASASQSCFCAGKVAQRVFGCDHMGFFALPTNALSKRVFDSLGKPIEAPSVGAKLMGKYDM